MIESKVTEALIDNEWVAIAIDGELIEPRPAAVAVARTPAAARQKVYKAVKRGELMRQPCEVCGRAFVHGHHDDYSAPPLNVRWLCPKHHRSCHVHV
jgi:hypothetical protein